MLKDYSARDRREAIVYFILLDMMRRGREYFDEHEFHRALTFALKILRVYRIDCPDFIVDGDGWYSSLHEIFYELKGYDVLFSSDLEQKSLCYFDKENARIFIQRASSHIKFEDAELHALKIASDVFNAAYLGGKSWREAFPE